MSKAEICKVPDTLKFQFQEDQEMHSSIVMENLMDKVVKYKIKTNKPGLYLVKPMEGQILSKGNVTIAFKRKQLTLENFNIIQNNPGQSRQKFLIELSCEVTDSVGIVEKKEQVAILGVSFTKAPVEESKSAKVESVKWDENKVRKDKIAEKKPDMASLISQKKSQLEKLIMDRQSMQARSAGSDLSTFTLQDLVNVLVVAFLLGFLIV